MATPQTAIYPLHRHLLRLVGLGAALAVGGAFFMYLCWKVPHPFLLERRQQGELAVLRAELMRARALKQQLKAEKQRLTSQQGIELEARRLNYVRPGERPIRFLMPPPPPPPAPTAPPPPPTLGTRLHQGSHALFHRVARGWHRFVYGR